MPTSAQCWDFGRPSVGADDLTDAPNFGTKFGWRWLRPRRVGPAGLLAMTMVFCHSEERSDVGIRPFYDERGFGPMYLGHGLRQPNSVLSIGPPRRRPLRKGGIAAATTQASGAQRSVCGADGRNGWKLRQGSSTKGPSTADNPSVSLRRTAPFTQGSLGDGECRLPRRFAPRTDSPDPLSF